MIIKAVVFLRLLVISFDAVGDTAFEAMAADEGAYPNIAAFKREARYTGGVRTVFVSNTYPIHCAVATGKPPCVHGVISNTLPPNAGGERPWAQQAALIRVKTVWGAAREKGLKTAAILWPVTCGARIDYHLPEVHTLKGQNQIIENLRHGGVRFQLLEMIKHAGKLKGAAQPYLDNFATAAACDALRRKPDLTLVHLIAYDDFCHHHGTKGAELGTAKRALDENLGRLLAAAGEDTAVIVFSDHSQLDVHTVVNLDGNYAGFEQCGGSAFYAGEPTDGLTAALRREPWFGRSLTDAELAESGYAGKAAFGIAAKPGFCFAESGAYKGNHGYPTDYENYATFYAIRGAGYTPGVYRGGSVTDVTKLIADVLNLSI